MASTIDENDDARTRPGGAVSRRADRLFVLVVFAAFAVGVTATVVVPLLLGAEGGWLAGYGAASEAAARERGVRSEYLVHFAGDPDLATVLAYFEGHPDIEYVGESIYPHTVRVSLAVPVAAAVSDIEDQPFVSFVIRNFPFLFCH